MYVKTLLMEWRLKQQKNVPMNSQVRNCHYYNSNTVCPFDDIGCKFKHFKIANIRPAVKMSPE